MSRCASNFSILSPAWRYIFGAITVALAAKVLIGNVIIVSLMMKIHSLRNRSNMILGSLATTDLLVGVVVAPMHILQFFFRRFRENCSFNSARRFLSVLVMGSSVASIALISYDRYVHLSKTQNYTQHMTLQKIGALISLCWIIPFFIPFAQVVGNDERFYGAVIFVYISSLLMIMLVSYRQIMKIASKTE